MDVSAVIYALRPDLLIVRLSKIAPSALIVLLPPLLIVFTSTVPSLALNVPDGAVKLPPIYNVSVVLM